MQLGARLPPKSGFLLPRDWEILRNSMVPRSLRKTFLACKMVKYFKKERFAYISKGSEKIHKYRSIKKKNKLMNRREDFYSLIFKSKKQAF